MASAGFKNPAALAKALNVSYSTVQRWFANSMPRGNMLSSLAAVLRVRYEWLESGIGERDAGVPQRMMEETAGEYRFRTPDPDKDAFWLQGGLVRAINQLENTTDPTTRAALAGHIQKLAANIEQHEIGRIAAGMPETS